MRTLTVLALVWASLALASAQTAEPFKGTSSNLGTEPAPYIPPPTAEPPAEPCVDVRVPDRSGAGRATLVIPCVGPSYLVPLPAPTRPAPAAGENREIYWPAHPELQPLAPPEQGNNYAPSPQPEKPKLTKAQKWARAFLVMGAVAGQVAIVKQCQQLRNKPLYLYRGGDLQNLRWCEASGY